MIVASIGRLEAPDEAVKTVLVHANDLFCVLSLRYLSSLANDPVNRQSSVCAFMLENEILLL